MSNRPITTRFRIGVRFRLMLGLVLVTAVALAGGGFGILGFNQLYRGFQVFTATQLPSLINAVALARQSESVVASAPGLVISNDQYSRTTAADRIADQVLYLDELLANLKKGDADSTVIATLEATKQSLLDNLHRIDDLVGHRIELDARSEKIIREILAISGRQGALVNGIFEKSTADPANVDLLAWSEEAQTALRLMLAGYGVQRSSEIGPFRKQATEAIDRAGVLLGRLHIDVDQGEALRRLHDDIRNHATGKDDVFAARIEILGLQQSVGGTLARNKVISDEFDSAVSGVVDTILRDLEATTANHRELISTYRQALIGSTLVAFALALAAFTYISRRVIRRIVALHDSMLAHAGGASAPIDATSRDEIGDMGRALQFFVTAIQRREEALTVAKNQAESALGELQTAQASLVHAQKMAALGQLTAGIAHEIKNPLNFVNNFAGLSVELLGELKAATAPAIAKLDETARSEIDKTVEMLTSNLEKITGHGRRADGIVRSMLEHSRGGRGERRNVDLNALVDEALNLAYHGARAQDPSFNITLEREYDRALTPIEVVPQDITRVFLNLIGNGFYAASKIGRLSGRRPVLRLTTRDLDDAVEIRVRDNGTGISPEIKDKLFQPFFTTKPTGEGTGLGLSISFEIVTQQHGGTIAVDSAPGEFTEFTITLPRRRQA